MAEVAVQVTLALISKALTLLGQEINRNQNVVSDVEDIRNDMCLLKACERDAEGGVGGELRNELVEQIRDLSQQMEDVLDEFMIHNPRHVSEHSIFQKTYEACHDMVHYIPVHKIQSQIAQIKKKVSYIRNSPDYAMLIANRPTGESSRHQQREQVIVEEEDPVGMESEKQELIQLLARGDSSRKTISVVGSAGSGKTLLVNSVYKSKAVTGQFDCHAWLSVPHSYNKDDLLWKLAYMINDELAINRPSSGADPATTLRNYLSGKRYLVVLDYVWKVQDFTAISTSLPNDRMCSRIIVTTQTDGVAEMCCGSDGYILRVKPLKYPESWTLFCNKAFGRNPTTKCPSHLLALAQGIVKRCEGIPQAISAVGSLLSRKGEQLEEWRRIHNDLGTHIQATCNSDMLEPSYCDLSSHLKACLLYFSMLPEDRSIKRERLIRLWVSEGFVEQLGGNSESAETTAERFLNELISRNLVTAISRDVRGRVESCRVQNLIRELILRKSKDSKFLEVDNHSQMHPRPGGANQISRRLSIEDASSSSVLDRPTGFKLDTVRSLFVFGFDNSSSSGLLEILERVRLLKILDLENAPLEEFPVCILKSAPLLRYLSLRNTNVSTVHKKIKKLRYLEYLDLKETKVTKLPEEICRLQYLRHLLVSCGRGGGVVLVGNLRGLLCLRKLCVIKVSQNPGFYKFLGHLAMLKKLVLVKLSSYDGKPLCDCIAKMQGLSTLNLTSASEEEYLEISHMGFNHPESLQRLYLKGKLKDLPTWFASLSGLVRLLLRGSKLMYSPVEILHGKMPSLMELKMNDAFTGEFLLFQEGGFPSLRTLRIEEFHGLDTVQFSANAMPMLEKLTFVRCQQLHQLPSEIEKLKKLQELLLWEMPQEFTSRLTVSSGDRYKVERIPCIRSHTFDRNTGKWKIQTFLDR